MPKRVLGTRQCAGVPVHGRGVAWEALRLQEGLLYGLYPQAEVPHAALSACAGVHRLAHASSRLSVRGASGRRRQPLPYEHVWLP
jgi:hypothetical protein